MKVIKIFNNNVALAIDDDNKEVIVRGLSLAYKYKIRDIINKADVEKVYVLQNDKEKQNFAQLMQDVPEKYFEVTEKIVSFASEKLQEKINDYILITLTDHICFSIKRHKENIPLVNRLLWEVKKFYPEEFKIGQYGLHLISTELGVELPEDEAANIAFHIVNAKQKESDIELTLAVNKMVRDILNIVKYHFGIPLDEHSLNYTRFITHLQFFSQRLLQNNTLESDDDFLYDQVHTKYIKEFECAKRIEEYVKNYLGIDISKDEVIYLTIHINRVINR